MADSQEGFPLVNELKVIEYMRDAAGIGSSGGGSSFQPTAGIPALSAEQLNQLMTQFLRTDGQFLQKAMQQNSAGMYNSTSRKLMANDLLAQAALKATMGQVDIAKSNASIAASNAAGARGSGPDADTRKREKRQQLLLAAGLAGLRTNKGAAMAGNAWESTKDFFTGPGDITQGGAFTDAPLTLPSFDQNAVLASYGAGDVAASLDQTIPYNDIFNAPDFGVDFGSFDFGSIPGVESTDALPTDFNYEDFFGYAG